MNDILKYTSKDYNSIYNDLLGSIPSLTNLWTNTNDADPGIVLVKLMSGLGDMLSFNLDKQALEFYVSTVTQRKNAAKLYELIGYRMRWYQSATNQITVTNTVSKPIEVQVVIAYDSGTEEQFEAAKEQFQIYYPYANYPQYYDNEGNLLPDEDLIALLRPTYESWVNDNMLNIYPYLTYENRNLNLFTPNYESVPYIIKPVSIVSNGEDIMPAYRIAPDQSVNIPVIQGSLHNDTFTSAQMQNNRYYFTETAIDEVNMWLAYTPQSTGNTATSYSFIEKTENLLTVTDGGVYFEFKVDEYDRPYIELSSYWKNVKDEQGNYILNDNTVFTIYFLRTAGSLGNITANYITNIEGLPSRNYTIVHPTNVVPYYDDNGDLIAMYGKNPELPAEAYANSRNWVTTFNTLVTLYDFERFCKRQEGFTNCFAVDKQRAKDLNDLSKQLCDSYKYNQLRAYADLSSEGVNITTLEELKQLYLDHTKVTNIDGVLDPTEEQDYKPYSVLLHLIYGDFALYQVEDNPSFIAHFNIINKNSGASSKNTYWLYQLIDNSEDFDDESPESGEFPPEPVDSDNPVYYLRKKYDNLKIATTKPVIAAVRVFPWRCCGTIHLKNPVSKLVADNILNTVMERLAIAFSPRNLEFGKQINYMDVINIVTNAHADIRYFDAGLGNRKLIDIDDSIDFTYFNPTSMMYYIQGNDTRTLPGTNFKRYGNNEEYIDTAHTVPNPYYQLLSIAPEYIIEV